MHIESTSSINNPEAAIMSGGSELRPRSSRHEEITVDQLRSALELHGRLRPDGGDEDGEIDDWESDHLDLEAALIALVALLERGGWPATLGQLEAAVVSARSVVAETTCVTNLAELIRQKIPYNPFNAQRH